MVVIASLMEVVEWSGGGHVVAPHRHCQQRWWSGGGGHVVDVGGGVVGHHCVINAGWGLSSSGRVVDAGGVVVVGCRHRWWGGSCINRGGGVVMLLSWLWSTHGGGCGSK